MLIRTLIFFLSFSKFCFAQNLDSIKTSNLREPRILNITCGRLIDINEDSISLKNYFDDLYKNRASIEFVLMGTSIFNQSIYGGAFEFNKLTFKDKLSLGIGFFTTREVTPKTHFSNLILEPRINISEFYLTLSCNSKIKSKIKINYGLKLGYVNVNLSDKAYRIKNGNEEVDKTVANNDLACIEPNVGCMFRLSKTNKIHDDYWLNIKTNYRHCIGRSSFGSLKSNNGIVVWLGLLVNYQVN